MLFLANELFCRKYRIKPPKRRLTVRLAVAKAAMCRAGLSRPSRIGRRPILLGSKLITKPISKTLVHIDCDYNYGRNMKDLISVYETKE